MEFKALAAYGQLLLSRRITLCCGLFQPKHAFFAIGGYAVTGEIHLRQIGLLRRVADIGGFFIIIAGFFGVFVNALAEAIKMAEIAQSGEVVIIGQRLP